MKINLKPLAKMLARKEFDMMNRNYGFHGESLLDKNDLERMVSLAQTALTKYNSTGGLTGNFQPFGINSYSQQFKIVEVPCDSYILFTPKYMNAGIGPERTRNKQIVLLNPETGGPFVPFTFNACKPSYLKGKAKEEYDIMVKTDTLTPMFKHFFRL